MPTLTRITVFPIKSLGGCAVTAARVLPGGALEHDRRFALVDAWGKFVNGKQCPGIHAIRAEYADEFQQVTLSHGNHRNTFSLTTDQVLIGRWCAEVLGNSCRLTENAEQGFPDDSEAPGPTLISTASLTAVADWFGLPLEEARRRFRANLEIDGTEPFWEDRLVEERTKVRRFAVGNVTFQGRNVCQRCAVPTRDARDGTVTGGFARRFAERREALLPEWAYRPRFDHFYRLAINTGLDSIAGEPMIRVGDDVTAIEDTRLASP